MSSSSGPLSDHQRKLLADRLFQTATVHLDAAQTEAAFGHSAAALALAYVSITEGWR